MRDSAMTRPVSPCSRNPIRRGRFSAELQLKERFSDLSGGSLCRPEEMPEFAR